MVFKYKFKNKNLSGSIKDEIIAISSRLYEEITKNPIGVLDNKYMVTFYNSRGSIIPFYDELNSREIGKNKKLKLFRSIKIGKFHLEDLAQEYYSIPYKRTYGKYNKPYNESDYLEMSEIYKVLLNLIDLTNEDINIYFDN